MQNEKESHSLIDKDRPPTSKLRSTRGSREGHHGFPFQVAEAIEGLRLALRVSNLHLVALNVTGVLTCDIRV